MYSIYMKILRSYTIDAELIEKMKGINASQLINNLLNDYFKKTDINSMDEVELERYIKIKELEEETKKRINEINGD